MARLEDVLESRSDEYSEPPQSDDNIVKDNGLGNGIDSKTDPSLIGIEDAAAIPKGTIDPVYDAKARVLNHAV
jgi:hypothetical protein